MPSRGISPSSILPSPAVRENLGRILRGFNFRKIAAIINKDELAIVESLYPLIKNKDVILRGPSLEYAGIFQLALKRNREIPVDSPCHSPNERPNSQPTINSIFAGERFTNKTTRNYKIACIDDSNVILNSLR
ncbi:MAG: hypothetical protein NZ901_07185 [Geminocystis sp.]|nr:hypothetical protein [Geminocystis sp.]HIK36586.1 hypothetical protein [Geminocystis sp. M7585_C2015_104]MCS7147958.1 hypothetical protein [Geminocystis sp.]MCX8078785.1 hypothetical protein [Geminocystis sp.]MDW8116846.1 hypothetical protein [Geminocystis sp.]